MPTVDTRPTGVDFRLLRGAAKTIRFRYPTSRAGRTFTLTIEGVTTPLDGTVSTTDVTFALTAELITSLAAHAGWTLTDTTGVDQVQLVGQFHPSTKGGAAEDETVTVVTTDVITVNVAIVGAPGQDGQDGADGESGVVAATSPATYDSSTRTVGVDQAALAALLYDTFVPQLEHGASLGKTSIVAGEIVLDVDTPWGVAAGVPYYDESGPTVGEEALLHVDADGTISWILLTEVA